MLLEHKGSASIKKEYRDPFESCGYIKQLIETRYREYERSEEKWKSLQPQDSGLAGPDCSSLFKAEVEGAIAALLAASVIDSGTATELRRLLALAAQRASVGLSVEKTVAISQDFRAEPLEQ